MIIIIINLLIYYVMAVIKSISIKEKQIVKYVVAVIITGVWFHFTLVHDHLAHVKFRSRMELENMLDLASKYFIESEDLCQLFGSKPVGNGTVLRNKNIFKIKLPPFLKEFKNPCYHRIKKRNGKVRKILRCLPYFFIIGAPKSGTTDLWQKIIAHPDVVLPMDKELMWFNRKRFGLGFMMRRREWSFDAYESCFSKATRYISGNKSKILVNGTERPYHHLVTGEASVDTIFDNDLWMQLPGNEGCSEPIYTNADYLKHLLPNIKLIVALRNPTERVYSDYIYESRYLKYNLSVEDFHKSVLISIQNHIDCLKYFTRRGCAYNSSIEHGFKVRLRIGIYYIFLRDWLRLFNRDQFLIIRFEDHVLNSRLTYRKLYNFLNLSPLTSEQERNIFNKEIPNTRKEKENIGDMLPETRRILDKFYNYYNNKLAYLLRDEKFLWQ